MKNTAQRFPLVPTSESSVFVGLQERFPDISEPVKIVFLDADGKIRAGCYFGEESFIVFDLGIIPDDIAGAGKKAVWEHAKRKAAELVQKERDRREARDRRMKSGACEEYVLDYEGVTIRGVARYMPGGGDRGRGEFVLTMSEPFSMETRLHVRPSCFGESMGHRRSFDDDGGLLGQEIDRQRETLVQMYKYEAARRAKPPAHPLLAELSPGRRGRGG